jgi:hypothetical protein
LELTNKMEVNYSMEKGLITYIIDGKITAADMRQLQAARDQLSANRYIKVVAIVRSFTGYENFNAFKDALLGDWRMLPKLSNYTILTDIKWLRILVSFLNHLVRKSKLKAFPLRDRKFAEKWLD